MSYYVWKKDKFPYELILQVDCVLADAQLWNEISKVDLLAALKFKPKIYSIEKGKLIRRFASLKLPEKL